MFLQAFGKVLSNDPVPSALCGLHLKSCAADFLGLHIVRKYIILTQSNTDIGKKAGELINHSLELDYTHPRMKLVTCLQKYII